MKRQTLPLPTPYFLGAYPITLPPGPTWPRHSHAYWELLLVIGGVMRAVTGNKETRAVPGTIFIRPPGVPHQEFGVSEMELKMHVLLWKYPKSVRHDALPAESFDKTGYVSQALYWLWSMDRQVLDARHPVLQILLAAILFHISQPPKTPETPRFSRVLAYIHGHLSEPLTVRHLAKIASLSESRFAHEFQRTTGVTPIAYVRKARIDHACRLITRSDVVLREVAREVGYRDEFGFSRVFRRVMGVSPGSLRLRSSKTEQA